jgi:riboflavin kinase/FMN adenylyltransferase
VRPTFDGLKHLIETFIFDFHDDIYRRKLTIELVARLRDEMKFNSAGQLKEQMARDGEKARDILMKIPSSKFQTISND